MWCWASNGGWWMPIGMLLMVAFWGVVIGLGVWLILRWVRSSGSEASTAGGNGALSVARERYAKGEISKEEFERIRRDLSW